MEEVIALKRQHYDTVEALCVWLFFSSAMSLLFTLFWFDGTFTTPMIIASCIFVVFLIILMLHTEKYEKFIQDNPGIMNDMEDEL